MEEADNQKSAEADCNAKQPVSFEKVSHLWSGCQSLKRLRIGP